jgi:hypothetical protein
MWEVAVNHCVLWLFIVTFFCRQATFPLFRLHAINSVKGFQLAERQALECILGRQEYPADAVCSPDVLVRKGKAPGSRVEISFRNREKSSKRRMNRNENH